MTAVVLILLCDISKTKILKIIASSNAKNSH